MRATRQTSTHRIVAPCRQTDTHADTHGIEAPIDGNRADDGY